MDSLTKNKQSVLKQKPTAIIEKVNFVFPKPL